MILYVNGDSHTAAAEAVNQHAFAEDDSDWLHLGRLPHPDNLKVSWGRILSDSLKAAFHCGAESASSNQRIMRTTRDWIDQHRAWSTECLVMIQWSTWERQEWNIAGQQYQVTASGTDDVPLSHRDQYRQFILDLDWRAVTAQAHEDIWNFHLELDDMDIAHVFFNGNNHFGDIDLAHRQTWGAAYLDPYDAKMTYSGWLSCQGYHTVSPDSWHFGKDSHAAWARFMLQYIVAHNLV